MLLTLYLYNVYLLFLQDYNTPSASSRGTNRSFDLRLRKLRPPQNWKTQTPLKKHINIKRIVKYIFISAVKCYTLLLHNVRCGLLYFAKRNGTKRNGGLYFAKRNGTKRNGTKRNGTKRNGTKRNGTKRNGTKRNEKSKSA